MLRARMEYGAVSAKVLALYGRLLTQEDWRRIYDCAAPSDVLAILRTQAGWSACVSELPQNADAESIKNAIRGKPHRDFERLYRFCSLGDKELLRALLCGEEYSFILFALRCLYSGESVKLPAETTDFMRAHSGMKIELLEQASDFAGLKAAVEGSAFAETLEQLTPEQKTGLPDYSEAGVALERSYYRYAFANVSKRYKGTGREQLTRLLGTQADLLNIVGILRLHRSFPGSLQSADGLLVPVCGRLKPKLTQKLLSARSEAEAVELLRETSFAPYFEEYKSEQLDRLYERAMDSFCRRLVKLPEPSICVAVAYLTLSRQESARLIRTIEALGYGIRPDEL